MTSSEMISAISKHRGLSIKELARKANIPYTTLYSIIKRNSNPKYEMLQRIADALSVPVGALLPFDESSAPRIPSDNTLECLREAIDNITSIMKSIQTSISNGDQQPRNYELLSAYVTCLHIIVDAFSSFHLDMIGIDSDNLYPLYSLNNPAEDSNSSTLTNLPSSAEED